MSLLELDTKSVPISAAELSRLIEATLRRSFITLGTSPVKVEGELPELASISIDASGGTASVTPPPTAAAVGPLDGGPSVETFQFTAHPLTARGISADIDLSAAAVTFSHGTSADGKIVATLKSVADGSLRIAIAKKQLEAAILATAKQATASAGVDIKAVDLHLVSIDPKTVDVRLVVTVKKFMTAVVRVTGRLAVDDRMTAVASGLKVDGDGMVGSVAAGFIRPHLQKIDGQKIPLPQFSFADVRLRDVAVSTADGVRIDAKFGGGL